MWVRTAGRNGAALLVNLDCLARIATRQAGAEVIVYATESLQQDVKDMIVLASARDNAGAEAVQEQIFRAMESNISVLDLRACSGAAERPALAAVQS